MSICSYHLRSLIRKTLSFVPAWDSEDAVELIMLTACAESDCGKYLRQINGIALGVFQIEPETLKDIYENWLNYRNEDIVNIELVSGIGKPDLLALEGNIIYGILLTRVMYLRAPGKLPSKHDKNGMAKYYVKWFNRGGKADINISIDKYRHFGLPI